MLPVALMGLLLAATAAILLVRRPAFAKAATLVALAVGFILSLVMTWQTVHGQTLSWSLGTPPWNVSVLVGPLEAFMACLFTGICALAMWASLSMIDFDVETSKVPLYYALICALIALLCGVVFFENMINVFIAIELSSFAAAGIVIIKNEPENIRAGLKYLTLSILGSGLVLMGIVILYTVTGTMAFVPMRSALASSFAGNENAVLYALIFITIGVSFKSALFPFHIWLPDAHATAPSPSSAVLSSLVLKAFLVFYIKVLYVAIGRTILLGDPRLRTMLEVVLVMGVVSMLFGSVMALLQTDIKRMIAYSSVAQIGYIFLGAGLGTQLGLFAALLHILAHAVAKSGLFLVAGSIIEQTHERRIDRMGGLGIRMPVTMALFTIGALSMIGIPLFIGFNSKWNFAMGVMQSGQYWVMIALALSTLLNALYYLPVVVNAYFGREARMLSEERRAGVSVSCERPLPQLLPIAILGGLVMLTAVLGGPIVTLIDTAVAGLW